MKPEQEVYLRKVEDRRQLAGGGAPGMNPAVDEALSENQAFSELAAVKAPPPERERQLTRAVIRAGAIDKQERRRGFAPWLIFRGNRRRVQAGAVGLALVVIVATLTITAVPRPQGDGPAVRLAPVTPAWAAEPGFVLEQDLGELDTAEASELARTIQDLVRQTLAGGAGPSPGPDSELTGIEDVYKYRLALPGVEREMAEQLQQKLAQLLREQHPAAAGTGGIEDAMFLLQSDAARAGATGSDWQPARELPDLAQLSEQINRMLEAAGNPAGLSVGLDRVGDRVILRLNGPEGFEMVGPQGRAGGNDVLLLRERLSGEPLMKVPATPYRIDESFDDGRGHVKIESDDGTFSFSYEYSSSSDSDSDSSSSSDSKHSSSSDHSSASDGSSSRGSDHGSAWGRDGNGGQSGGSRHGSSSSSSGGGGGGGNCGGGGSAGGSGSTSHWSDSSAGGGSGGQTLGATGDSASEPQGRAMGGGTGAFGISNPYAEHNQLIRDYIAATYPDQDVSYITNGKDGVLSVEITHDEQTEHMSVTADDQGNLVIEQE